MHRPLGPLALVPWLSLLAVVGSTTGAGQELRVYGPGGPEPAIREAAAQFGAAHGVKVVVTAGPTAKWIAQAKADADVVYSGSETMMTDFLDQMGGELLPATVTPLYLRVSAILVRPGNPKHIARFDDLLAPGVKVLVVNGAGQNGLWEDIAGRKGRIATVKALRKNIALFTKNSGEAAEAWKKDPSFDAWLTWTIWQGESRGVADVIPIEPDLRIYRDAGVALTRRGQEKPAAREFAAYLAGPEGARIFKKMGWIVE
ncbi:MAG TPA: extracellular solute-binding protein [Myxococcaceae bacterium]